VTLDDGGTVVTKTFHGADAAEQLRLAREEFGRLRIFSRALADVAGASSPEPLEVVPGPPAQLRMARAPGVSVKSVLRRRRLGPRLQAGLAATAARALDAYVGAVGEPYHDFHFDNMLYDERANALAFVDLGVPERSEAPPAGASAVEISLGNLIGAAIFESAKPNEMVHRRQHRQACALCADVAAGVADADRLDPEALADCARAAYTRAAHHGPAYRRLWYGVIGPLVARHVIVAGQRITVAAAAHRTRRTRT
jgi:hypothetical protein